MLNVVAVVKKGKNVDKDITDNIIYQTLQFPRMSKELTDWIQEQEEKYKVDNLTIAITFLALTRALMQHLADQNIVSPQWIKEVSQGLDLYFTTGQLPKIDESNDTNKKA